MPNLKFETCTFDLVGWQDRVARQRPARAMHFACTGGTAWPDKTRGGLWPVCCASMTRPRSEIGDRGQRRSAHCGYRSQGHICDWDLGYDALFRSFIYDYVKPYSEATARLQVRFTLSGVGRTPCRIT